MLDRISNISLNKKVMKTTEMYLHKPYADNDSLHS